MFTTELIFSNDSIVLGNETVMHKWEHPIMKAKAEFVCKNGGDIIEFGFGMGISATYIQEHNINSHTICEIHPEIIKNLKEWAKDKPNVIILEGDWYRNLDKMKTYDGILFDTHQDSKAPFFGQYIPQLSNPNCHITWWNGRPEKRNWWNLDNVEFDTLQVDPPLNDYFNHKQYFLPKYIYTQ